MDRLRQTQTSTLLLMLILSGLGCTRSNRASVLEGQLRKQEQYLAQLQQQLQDSQSELELARRQAEIYRQQIASEGGNPLLPEQTNLLARAQKIQFQKLLTGGYDEDGIPGDELLSAVIMPIDAQGDLMKLPGVIQLEVIDPNLPEEQRQVSHWKFSEQESREVWLRGLLGAGYFFKLPWQSPPTSDKLLLYAQLTSVDGRQFKTSQLIRVRPQSGDAQPVPTATPLSELLPNPDKQPAKRARFETVKEHIPADFFDQNPPAKGQSGAETLFKPVPAPIPLEQDESISTSERWTEFDRPIIR